MYRGIQLPSGRANVEFVLESAAQSLLRSAGGPNGGNLAAPVMVGNRGNLRVFPKLPERGRLHSKSGGDYEFQATCLVVGSLVDQVLFSELQIMSSIQVTLSLPGRCFLLEFKHEGIKYRLEARFKQINGHLLLTQDHCLMMTLQLPPKIWRWQLNEDLKSLVGFCCTAGHLQSQCLQALKTMGSSGGPLLQPARQLRELMHTFLESAEESREREDTEDVRPPQLQSGYFMVPRVLLTPARVKLLPAEPEMSNRVVRHFCSHGFQPRDFVRVSCGEEDGHKLFSPTGSDELAAVYANVQTILNDGLTILGRQYQFLAYSSSQLKEQSVWMVHCPPGHSPDTMRSWMGDFMTGIKVPAKCAARMGQCFSTTVETVAVEHFEQVRFQGMKGVLCLNPNLQGKVLRYRRSMQKFVSSHSTLEVVSVAARIPCFLNRFLIILLVGNGISRTIFEDMQLQLVRQLDTLLSGNASLALAALLKVRCGDSMCQDMLVTMLTAGLSAATDPLLKRCLEAVRMHLMMDLKHKARIPVSKGVVLMGGLDHTELLPEKTVFLQVSQVTVAHLIQHFIDHAKNDNLGQIANAWLVHADSQPSNTSSPQCQQLAALHSTAVDFPKTGIPAIMSRELIAHEVPHFMGRKDKRTYVSGSVLGRMYDQVLQDPAVQAYSSNRRSAYLRVGSEQIQSAQPDPRISNIPGRQRFQRLANEEYCMYLRYMMQLMNKYHLQHEGEILTGCIVKYHKLQKRKQHETRQEVAAEVHALQEHYRKRFWLELVEMLQPQTPQLSSLSTAQLMQLVPGGILNSLAQAKAAAYYMTSYPTHVRQGGRHPSSAHPAAAEQQPPSPSLASQLGPSPATASAASAHAADVPVSANASDTQHHAAPAHLPAQTAAVAATEAGCGVGSFGALGGVSQQGGFAHQGDDSDDEDREDEEADDARAGRRELVLYSFPWVVASDVLGGYLRAR
ncbi:MAG: hypothetical protein WDW38_002529 [Sanguina aurantia]